MHRLLLAAALCAFSIAGIAAAQGSRPSAAAEGLKRIRYNNPGLEVDLGVGLWAWPLPMDFDQDGDLDLVVNCPDKPHNGVWFFENATGDTAKTPLPVFKPARKISQGLQYAQVSYLQGFGQGRSPIVLTPGVEYPDFLRTGLAAGRKLPVPPNVHPNKVRGNMWRVVDFDGDGRRDLIVGADDWTDYGWDNAYNARGEWTNGPLRGFVYLLRNVGDNEDPAYSRPEKVTAADKPVQVFGWPSPNFADFDGDGDLDLLCGEFLDGFTYFENTGTRRDPDYAAGRRLKSGGRPLTMDLEMITPTAIDWDRDGDQDLIVGDEDGRVAFIEHTGKVENGLPVFRSPRYFRQEADEVKFGALATPVGFDWDGDGDTDILSGNTAGYIGFIENLSGPGVEAPKWAAPRHLKADGKTIRIQAGPNGSIQGPCEAKWGYTALSVADWDHDGLPDLVVNSIWGKVHWYRNTGSRRSPRLAAAAPIEIAWEGAPMQLSYGWLRPQGNELLTQWRTTPAAVDWTRDGLTDLVMLDAEGYLCLYERFRRGEQLALKPPRRVFSGENFSSTDSRHQPTVATPGLIRLNDGIAGKSGRRKLCVVDWDADGRLDVLVNSANANFLRQTSSRGDTWRFTDMGLLSGENIEGHDVSPAVVDWNADGLPDFLGGAEDGFFYYLRNPKSPAR